MNPRRVVSVDSHVSVSHEAIKGRLQSGLHDAYDAAVASHDRAMAELRGGQAFGMEIFRHEAATRAGYRDPYERLRDMDVDGVEAEILYSELSAFRFFPLLGDGWREVARAFNDVLADFASVDPKRLLVSYQLPILDIDFAIEELERLADRGARSVHLPNHPQEVGCPDYFDARYDPLWARLSEIGIPVSQHLGIKESLYDVCRRDPTPQKGIFATLPALMLAETLGFWILTGVLERFPNLRIVMVEPGLTWVPFYLDQLDVAVRAGFEFPGVKELPSDYFKRQMYLTFVEDARGLRDRHELGVENLMWSTDYPHPQCSWPNSLAVIERQFAGIPEVERDLIVGGNAARVYGL
ncbi:MAG: amidohydrolase [Acidimicrobiia bacterium]